MDTLYFERHCIVCTIVHACILSTSEIELLLFSDRENFGSDLLALNIQRARDHGIPGYNAYRKACGVRELKSWNQRPTEITKEYWNKLKEVYESVDDIDLYVGGVGEKSVRGGVVGPTFACLIADQVSIDMEIFMRGKEGYRPKIH